MLEKEEIKKIAKIKGLTAKNTEKDYLLEILLFLLYKETGINLVFKGGTALYKLYSLNRFSEDLDFTLNPSKINIGKLFKKLIHKLRDINIEGRIKEITEYKNQKNIKLELKGPLFDGNPNSLSLITINISLKEKPVYKPEQKMIFSKYSDITSFDVFIMPLNELFAEKIRCIITRDKARDIYDAWFMLKKGVKISIKDINRKLKLYKEKFNKKKLIGGIEKKRKSWETDLKGLIIGELHPFDLVVKDIKDYLSEADI